MNLKHMRIRHNSYCFFFYHLGQTTDWLSEEYGLVSEITKKEQLSSNFNPVSLCRKYLGAH